MTKPKYTGKLATAIPQGLLLAVAVEQYSGKGDNDFLDKEWTERMMLLLKHYKIAPTDLQCWHTLAWWLAFDHVPGFRVSINLRGRGRPRKHDPDFLVKIKQEAGLLPRRRRGRPREETDPEALISSVEAVKQELSATKNRKVTDKEVLEYIIEEFAKDRHRSVTIAKAKFLPKAQKRLSRARRNSNKSE